MTVQNTTNIVFADIDMARSVFQNLITDALKFTTEGGAVENFSLERDGMIQVTMPKTGISIAVEKAEKVFAFEQKISTRGSSGETDSSTGLVLSKGMVAKNGGRICCESDPGNGSRFHFTLPVERAAE